MTFFFTTGIKKGDEKGFLALPLSLIHILRDAREPMEKAFRSAAKDTEAKALELLKAGKAEDARALLNAFTDQCLDQVDEAVSKITEAIEKDLSEHPGSVYRAAYLKALKEKTGM